VHYVVTEYGVAYLYAKTLRQRARALIDIAAPEFRAELEQKAIELKYL
jgi:acetyl-CoA hydrolase